MSSINSNAMEKRSLRSGSFPQSPIARSPMPKSPMPKSPAPYEKYKSRCAYGLISFFHFGHGHSKKMISDRKRPSKHASGNHFKRNKLGNAVEKCQCSDDGIKQRTIMTDSVDVEVKQIIGEGASAEQQIKREAASAKVQHVSSDSEFVSRVPRHHRRNKRTSRRRFPMYGCYDISTVGHEKPAQQNALNGCYDKLDSTVKSVQESSQTRSENERDRNSKSISTARHEKINEINLQVHLSESAEAFINQKLTDGKHNGDGLRNQSKNFLEALEILNSNKDLFIKLLQDPNSLLVKHIEDLRDSQPTEQETKPCAEAGQLENQASYANSDTSAGSSGRQSLEDIVILKPDPTFMHNSVDKICHEHSNAHNSLRTVQQSVKPTIFQFEQMKRKLMRAMGIGRKHQLLLTDGAVHKRVNVQGFRDYGSGTEGDGAERKSTRKAVSDVEGRTVSSLDVKKTECIGKNENSETDAEAKSLPSRESSREHLNLSSVRHPRQTKNDKFVDTRILHAEMLDSGNVVSLKKQKPKTWDGIGSISEYDLLPTSSPTRKKEHGIVTPQMRFPPYSNAKIVSDSLKNQSDEKSRCLSTPDQDLDAPTCAQNEKDDQRQDHQKPCNALDKNVPDTKIPESIGSFNNEMIQKGNKDVFEAKDKKNIEGASTSGPTYKRDDLHENSLQNNDAAKACETDRSLDFSRLDSPLEIQTSACSSPLSIQRSEDFDTCKTIEEQPSPVSVLEHFSQEVVMSPLSTEHDEPPIPHLQIGSEDDSSVCAHLDSSAWTEEQRSVFECVSTVVRVSGLNWDDLSLKCNSVDEYLDQSSCDGVDMGPIQSYGSQKLLFAYINEVLAELCHNYIRYSPWVSCIRLKVQKQQKGENLVSQVMKHINWKLLLGPPHETMDQIVDNDLYKSSAWMDIRVDTEDIVSEVVETILEELVTDTAAV